MSIDGTDFRVAEIGNIVYSHRFLKFGVWYEVGICILIGDIVWIHGTFNCGEWTDIEIFHSVLLGELEPGERIEVDDVYIGEHPQKVKCPKGAANCTCTLAMQ